LDDNACQLLTLVGPGGSGKTRLAIQIAMQKLDDFPDGVYFAPLAPLSSAENILPTISNTLELQSDASEIPRQQLLNYLHQKHLLMILDNFEHLLDGTALVTDILVAAPEVKILVTSRESLNLEAEWVRHVSGMP